MLKLPPSISSHMRFPSIIASALIANLLIFYVIQQMVTNEQFRAPKLESINLVDFIRIKEQRKKPDEIIEDEIIDEPPPPEEPPPPPEMLEPEIQKPELSPLDISMPELDVPLGIDGTPFIGDFMKSVRRKPRTASKPSRPKVLTNVVPTIKIPPSYPKRALRSGIEGVVTVEFTIATDGSVKDPVIIEAKPPKIFDRSVLKSIAKWKFNPEIKDGEAVEMRARQDVNFKLKE